MTNQIMFKTTIMHTIICILMKFCSEKIFHTIKVTVCRVLRHVEVFAKCIHTYIYKHS